jgi:HK97 family phage major capsid protein
MTLLTSPGSGSSILTPEQVQTLVVEPLTRTAVATQISTVITIDTHTTRFPVVVTDAASGWTAEGDEIDISDPDLDELEVTPKKLAALVVVSNELVADSNPAALTVVGDSVVRDLAVKLDHAYFGHSVTDGPDGIASLGSVQTVNAGSTFTDLDWAAEALAKLEQVDSSLTRSFVAHPSTLLQLSELKIGTDWNLPLLGPDATSPTRRSILGVPAYWSAAVEEDAIWLVAQSKAFVVMRNDTDVRTDTSAFFSSDRTAIRATMRVSFGWPHQQAVVKVNVGGGS